ncbi:MAG: hypothetical protein M0Z61_12275 [Nitrospiraceae bacterium]|nr:hypothetical protein [Nitrospiraceae bacterium]
MKKLPVNSLDIALYVLFLFFNTTFFFFDLFHFGKLNSLIAALIAMAIALRKNSGFKFLPPVFFFFLFVLLSNISKLINYDKYGFFSAAYVSTLFQFIFLGYLLSEDKAVLKKVFDVFLKLLLVLTVPGIIYYFLILFSVNIPYHHVDLGGRGVFLYRDYQNLAIVAEYPYIFHIGRFTITRLCGMFEEPGMLATILGVLLIADMIVFPEKKRRKYFIIAAGLMTFSFAFMIFLLSMSLFYMKKRHVWKIVAAIFILALAYIVLAPAELKNMLNILVFNRFIPTEDASSHGMMVLSGDDRIGFLLMFLDYFKNETLITQLFGNGPGSNQIFLSFAPIIYEYGLIGFFLVISMLAYFFIYLPVRSGKKKYLLLTLMPLLSMYQRPDFISGYYFIAYAMMMISFNRGRLGLKGLALDMPTIKTGIGPEELRSGSTGA